MKLNFMIPILTLILLAACSTGQVNSVQATSTALQTQPTVDQPTAAVVSSSTAPAPTPSPKPPLAKDAWMQMPAVPTGISDSMREIYQRGLELGNDPNRFAVIGDCQNVSSYFLATFDKPGDFSLGDEYAYLQITIDYYRGSFSRTSLAVKGGFNVAAVLSPLRADPKSCNPGESPLDCELRVWNPSVVFVGMETWWSEKPARCRSSPPKRITLKVTTRSTRPSRRSPMSTIFRFGISGRLYSPCPIAVSGRMDSI